MDEHKINEVRKGMIYGLDRYKEYVAGLGNDTIENFINNKELALPFREVGSIAWILQPSIKFKMIHDADDT